MTSKKQPRTRYIPLSAPPQKLLLRTSGQAKKTLVITLISIIAIVALAALLFFTSTFVGKAITAPSNEVVDLVVTGENSFTLVADLNGEKSNGIYFELESKTSEFNVCSAGVQQITVEGPDGWQFTEEYCIGNKLIFGEAALDESTFVGEDDFTEFVTFILTNLPPGELTLTLSKLNLYGVDADKDLFSSAEDDFVLDFLAFSACDPACEAGQQCEANVCKPIPECSVDTDCEIGEMCTSGVCEIISECSADTDCEIGEMCTSGVCEIISECSADTDCEIGEICNSGVCEIISECSVDTDCEIGEMCTSGVCELISECSVDTDCEIGEMCTSGVCELISECISDEECNDRKICDENFECVIAGCRSTEECAQNNVCKNSPTVHVLNIDDQVAFTNEEGTFNIVFTEVINDEAHFDAIAVNTPDTQIQDKVISPLAEGVTAFNLPIEVKTIVTDNQVSANDQVTILLGELGLCEFVTAPTPTPTPSSGGTGGSGGGCVGNFQCGAWGLCNSSLQESRTCTDVSRCKKDAKTEIQSCPVCEESWVCKSWSSCSNQQQTRTCVDEHKCGTITLKPALSQFCQGSTSLPPLRPATPPSYTPPPPQKVIVEPTPSIWEQYKNYIIGGGIGLLTLIVIIALIIFMVTKSHKKDGGKHKVYNFDDLVDWVKKEKQVGASNQEIKQLLEENTGWNKVEVDQAFTQLNEEATSTPQTTQ
jgi:hypothetical protein